MRSNHPDGGQGGGGDHPAPEHPPVAEHPTPAARYAPAGNHPTPATEHPTHSEHSPAGDHPTPAHPAGPERPTPAAPAGPSIGQRIKNTGKSIKEGVLKVAGYEHFQKPPEKTTGPRTLVGVLKDYFHGTITNIALRRPIGAGKILVNSGKELPGLLKPAFTTPWHLVRHPLKSIFRPDKMIARVATLPLGIIKYIKDRVKETLTEAGTGVAELYKGALEYPITRLGQQVERIPKIGSPVVGTIKSIGGKIGAVLSTAATPIKWAINTGKYFAEKAGKIHAAIKKHAE